MATTTFYTDTTQAMSLERNQPFIIKKTIDLSLSVTAGTTDTITALNIPKGVFVHKVGVHVVTVSTGTADIDSVGDGDDPNGWIDADIELTSTANNSIISIPTDAYPVLGGKLYLVADTIDLLMKTAVTTNGTIEVWALCHMMDNLYSA